MDVSKRCFGKGVSFTDKIEIRFKVDFYKSDIEKDVTLDLQKKNSSYLNN